MRIYFRALRADGAGWGMGFSRVLRLSMVLSDAETLLGIATVLSLVFISWLTFSSAQPAEQKVVAWAAAGGKRMSAFKYC